MTVVSIVSLIIAFLSLILAYIVHRRNTKALRRIEAIQVASKSKDEVHQIERLLKDIERNRGVKKGQVVQREDGTWYIKWSVDVGGGIVRIIGKLRLHILRVTDKLRCK